MIKRFDTAYGFSVSCQEGSFFAKTLESLGKWEPVETEAVSSVIRRNDFVVDVGAHVGWYSLLSASRGASVFAFEPNPTLFELLEENVRRSNWSGSIAARPWAIGEEHCEDRFYLPSTYDDGWGSLRHSDLGDAAPVVDVSVFPLRDVVPDGERIRLLKTDTEGAELFVLKSFGARLFSDVDYVFVELNDERLKYFDTRSEDVVAYLVGAGFNRELTFGENALFKSLAVPR